jgi:hypothetical protein
MYTTSMGDNFELESSLGVSGVGIGVGVGTGTGSNGADQTEKGFSP